MTKLSLAISITATAFIDVLDKGGQPYILHCLRVMQAVSGEDEDTMCAAIMHDLLEDTDWTEQLLISSGFNSKVIYLLKLLTKEPGEDYVSYIRRIEVSKEATKVKLADLEDNTKVTRLKGLSSKDFERLQKYISAYTYLKTKHEKTR